MTPPGELPDHNSQLRAARSCHACKHDFTHEQVGEDLGWEPTRLGWRCGACSRRRRRDARARALRLIEQTKPRWSLVLRSPVHHASSECFQCEALRAAQAMLLSGDSPLTAAEADALCAAIVHEGTTD
jgi:hypothetical protein